eukprot:gene5099-10201_t
MRPIDTQKFVPPLRFGTVNSELYRGAYPTLRNFRFLRRLRLKTIISLTPEPPNADITAFADIEKISVIHFQALRLVPLNNQLQIKLCKALQYIIDEGNLPVYIHCLDGRRVTGFMVLLLRRLQFWAPQASFTEFWRYQDSSNVPISELERTSGDIDKFLLELNEEIIIPENIPKWLWGGQRNTLVPGLRLKHIPAIESNLYNKTEERQQTNINNNTSNNNNNTVTNMNLNMKGVRHESNTQYENTQLMMSIAESDVKQMKFFSSATTEERDKKY